MGTAYEMGFGKALGKTVLAYSNNSDLFLKRNLNQLPNAKQVDEQTYVDGIGMTLENFGLIDNLMLDNAVSGPIELENVGVFYDQTEVYRNLRAFIRCLEQLKNDAKAA